MKLNIWILQKDNSIIKKKINNFSEKFEVTYIVDGQNETFPYKFNNKKIFKVKTILGFRNICFYEHASMDPLNASFNSNANDIQEIYNLSESKLIKSLVDSAKNKIKELGLGLVLGLAGILALVIIVVFG